MHPPPLLQFESLKLESPAIYIQGSLLPFFTVRNDLWRCDEATCRDTSTWDLRRLAAGKEDFLLSHSIRVLVPQRGRGRPSRNKEESFLSRATKPSFFFFFSQPVCWSWRAWICYKIPMKTSSGLYLWSLASGGLSDWPTDWPNFLPARCPNFLVVRALPGIEELVARRIKSRNAATFTSRNPGFYYSISGLRFMG